MKPNAKQAIQILDNLRHQLGQKYLPYWTLPNTVLTLSGARALCDGVFWDDNQKGLLEKWNHEITESIAIIKEHTHILWSEAAVKEARPGEKYASYELITEPGLRHVLANTTLLKEEVMDQLKQQTTAEGFPKTLIANLKSQEYSDENLNHIASGILLGYPDKAITESVLAWEEDDPFAEPLITADVR